MLSYMTVIRLAVGRFVAWMGSAALAGAEAVLKAAIFIATASVGVMETSVHRVESRRASARLEAARRAKAANRWRAAFEAAPLGMAKVSLDGRLEEVNSAFCALLGEPERALVGRRLSALIYPDDISSPESAELGEPRRGDDVTKPGKGIVRDEVRLVCAGGRLRWCELASSVLRNADGAPENTLVHVVDITRHKRSQAALRDLATRDPLSGLANRRWFELQLAQHVRTCAEEGPRGALLLMDLDNFKSVNDSLGHQAGDRLVIEVAVTLRRHLRDHDLVARLGGDEFAIVLHDGDGWAAEAVARKLVLAVRDEVTTGFGAAVALEAAGGTSPEGTGPEGDIELRTSVTLSVGVAPFELLAGAGPREALKAADAAMYSVKRSGRNGYAVVGAPEGPHHARRRAHAVPDLSDRQVSLSGASSV
jgi:diguanylate cyclase (GGDEF)-like protein/PAS domain S-box-containing protein